LALEIAPDDIVASPLDAAGAVRPPLLVEEPLLAFLDAHGLGSGPMTAVPVGDGHSNVTFLIERDGAQLILRRPPRPPVPPSAHDVLREARVIAALAPTGVAVPRVLATCADPELIGCPFFVMERIDGHVVTDALPPTLDTPAQRRRLCEELVGTLAQLHAVDWRSLGLEGFGRPTGYLERQVRRFLGLWEVNRTRDVPEVQLVGEWLRANLPDSPAATIVHGDYRPGNAMFGRDSPARLLALLDWEMSTLGDPLADVGFLCATWSEAGDPVRLFDLSPVTREAGFMTRRELLEAYERHSGRRVDQVRWYATLALWKSVVFMEGNYRRAILGASDDPYMKQFGDGVLELAERAHRIGPGGSDDLGL
jgi:aminoglycoside phosphotransferase (APT) family kinase protein